MFHFDLSGVFLGGTWTVLLGQAILLGQRRMALVADLQTFVPVEPVASNFLNCLHTRVRVCACDKKALFFTVIFIFTGFTGFTGTRRRSIKKNQQLRSVTVNVSGFRVTGLTGTGVFNENSILGKPAW